MAKKKTRGPGRPKGTGKGLAVVVRVRFTAELAAMLDVEAEILGTDRSTVIRSWLEVAAELRQSAQAYQDLQARTARTTDRSEAARAARAAKREVLEVAIINAAMELVPELPDVCEEKREQKKPSDG